VAGKLHHAPFVLKGPFGEADTEAIDAEPDSELATDAMSMDVEVDAEGAAAMMKPSITSVHRVFYPTYPRFEKVYRTVGPRPRHNK
jgi:hypothetical protein